MADDGMFGSTTPQKRGMDEQDLLAVIREFEQESYGYTSGDLAAQRAYAIERYLALPYGDEVDGRSSVVDTGLRDTIEWVLPQLLKVFLAGDKVVEINPTSAEDEKQATQETDYVNHVILEKNDAFNLFSTWFRDALMTKMGYTKAYWIEKKDILSEVYRGISDDQLMMLEGDKDVEIVEQQSYPDPLQPSPMPPQPMAGPMPGTAPGGPGAAPQAPPPPPQQPPMAMLHDVKLRRLKTQGYVKIDNVPAEEIRIHRSTRTINLEDCLFIRHSARRTLSSLRQDGYKIPDDVPDSGDDMGNINDQISISRDRFADDSDLRDGDLAYLDPAARRVWFHEDYVRVDYDGDGIAELRKVCHIGNLVLANEEEDVVPFAAITPIVFPHRHVGIGFDDLCDMPSKVATAIQRQFLDNLYLQNNGRYGIDATRVNVDDMLTSRPGGLVRTDGPPGDSIFPFTHPATGQAAMEGLQWAQQWREISTGVSPDQSNLSADALSNVAPGTVAQSVAAGQARVEAIARSFATGVKELFGIVHALTLKNATHDEKIKLNNNWVVVDPREWVKRTSMTITVGLGTGTKESRIMGLQQVAMMQQQGLQIGVATPANLYHTGQLITQEMGYKNADDFWSDPAKNPPPPPQPPPPVQVAQINAQTQMQAKQMDLQAQAGQAQQQLQIKQQELQMTAAAKQQEQQNALALQASNDQRDAQAQQLQHQRELQKMALDNKFKYDQMAAQFEFDAREKEMDRQSQERMHMRTAAATAQSEGSKDKASGDRHGQLLQALTLPREIKIVRDK